MRVVSPPYIADPVATALRTLNVRSTVFCLSELGAPWSFRVEGADMPKFHLVLEGSGWVMVEGQDAVSVTAGDLVLLPHGHAHTIASEPGRPAIALDRLVDEHPLDEQLRLRCGGDGPVTRLLCGGFAVAERDSDPTLALVPDVLRLEGNAVAAAVWVAPLLAMLDRETRDADPGASAVLAKVADVFLTQALRIWLVGAERAGLFLCGPLQDGPISKALAAIRERPAEAWSLDSLASLVGMSRTSFSTRFHALVGEPPMRYVAKARLGLAAGHLATSGRSIYEIARLAGYRDESTLSKSFRREFGVPPGRYRAAARHEPAITVVQA